jgi:hypothetical protein|uniref:Uncharacterized protein n=1 Tax=Siphoviridae sp. ctoiW10 TaxID=2827592 RepID=A0A8S5LPC1_9CAUD|nr:MAG TPA: hypothetical protein [Siphoviridae sp. ctoiW10]
MKKKFLDIINEGKAAGKTIEAVNAELKAAGANFHLTPDGYIAGWSDKEMAEGFIPAEDDGKDALYKIASDGKPVRYSNKAPGGGKYGSAIPVMERDESRADTTITVGHWELSYDSLGYCYSRKNLNR